MITGELKNKIDGIWDIFWSSGMTNPLTVIEQITYLMFIKILDDNELRKEANAAAFDMEVVDPIFDEAHQNCRWSKFRHFEAEAMLKNMTDNVFPFIKNDLHAGKDTAFARYMKDALFLVPTARVLVRVVDALDSLDLNNKDIMGDVYEYLLSQIAQSGTNGQFRTPRHIIKMMVELMEPSLADAICDPAMGSAGFITAAAQYVSEHYAMDLMKTENKRHYTTTMFSGFDTDQTMLRIGAMNMMLHGVEAPNITWMDSLSEDNTHRDEYTLIMANPPFTGSLDKETISKDLLAVAPTKKTELLFLALFLKALKVGGRCASIVPDGVLFGSSKAHKALRQELVEFNRLEAVISMPSGVFKPYAGVSTAILIFTKTGHGGTDKVWFYDMAADGFSLDDKRSPIEANDIPDIIERFHNLDHEESHERTEKSFFVPKQEIVDNGYDLSINKYKKVEYQAVEYPPTSEIVEELDRLNREVVRNTSALKDMLGIGRTQNTAVGGFEVCKEAAGQFYITAQKCLGGYLTDGFYPYAVNIAFACELYMKAIMIHRSQENEFHKGHNLKDLFSYLVAEDAQSIKESFNKQNQHQQLSDFLAENGTVFVDWRYALERQVSMNLTGFELLSEILKDYVEALK